MRIRVLSSWFPAGSPGEPVRLNRHAWLLLLLPPLATAAGLRPLPYPPSCVLAGLEWTSPPHRYPGIHSDMHWQSWGADDEVWSVDGDGSFPGAGNYYGSLSRITGTPPDIRIELVTQFRELRIREEHTPEGMRRYFCGPRRCPDRS